MTSVTSGQLALGYGTQPYGTSAYGGEVGGLQAYYAYDAASRRTKTLLGNGCATYYSYDAANRLTSQNSILPNRTALVYFSYGYDAASRITKIGREAGKTIYYSYDNADRLTGENWYNAGMQNVYAFAWGYDAVGNRGFRGHHTSNCVWCPRNPQVLRALQRTERPEADAGVGYRRPAGSGGGASTSLEVQWRLVL